VTKLKFEVQITDIEKINPLFSKCKIYVCYPDLNRNNSSISKQVIIDAIPTIFNCPILGEYNETLEDFGSHGGKIEIKEDKVSYIQTTKAYGVIPESSEISWEIVNDKEYLVCTGYLWVSRYPEVLSVLEEGKSHSMEIGEIVFAQKDDYMEVKSFVFTGLCILGDTVEPCFEDSKIIAYSLDRDNFKNEFNQMVRELKYSLSNSTTSYKDWCNSNVNIKFNNLKEQNTNKELDITNSNIISDELLNKNFGKEEDEIMLFNKEEFAQTFKLTAMQLYDVLVGELCKATYIQTWYDEAYETSVYWMDDYDDQFVYAYNRVKGIDVKIPYSMEGDNAKLDFENEKRIKYTPTDWDDSMGEEVGSEFAKSIESFTKDFAEKMYSCGSSKMAVEKDTAFAVEKETFETEKKEFEIKLSEKDIEVKDFELKYNELDLKHNESETKYSEAFSKLEAMSDYENLKTYKADKTISEKDAMFSQFSTKLSEDEMKSIKDKSADLSVDEIKDKLFALVGQKNFSLNSNSIITMGIGGFDEKEVISTDKPYSDIINKHAKNKNNKQ